MGATYINTDLEIRARFDIALLVAEFTRVGFFQLGEVTIHAGVRRAAFELEEQYKHPSEAIDRLLDVVEGLGSESRSIWDRCLDRRFDVGLEGCDDSFYSRWEVGPRLLQRLARVNASFVVTIYSSAGRYNAGEVSHITL